LKTTSYGIASTALSEEVVVVDDTVAVSYTASKENFASSIADITSRPVKIATYTQADFPTSTPSIKDFAQLWLDNAHVQRKLMNYRFFRGTLNLQFIVSSLPYTIGLLNITLVEPFFTVGTSLHTLGLITYGFNAPHVTIDLSKDTCVNYSVPWIMNKHYAQFDNETNLSDWSVKFNLNMPSALQNTNGDTPTFTLSVHATLSDVELVGPVPILAESEQYHGVISAPASAVANAAVSLQKIPVIRKLAKATEIGAKAVAGIAHLFGFSRPSQIPSYQNFATGIGTVENVSVFSQDPRAEVSIDPKLTSDSTDDPMALANIVSRWGLAATLVWPTTAAVGSTLGYLPVTPCLCPTVDLTGIVALTPLAHVSIPFTAWTGTLKFRFVITGNRFTHGKLRFWWAPGTLNETSTLSAISASACSLICDVAGTTTAEISVGWNSNYGIMTPNFATESEDPNFDVNGFLYVTVEEKLHAPTSVNAAIYCFICADPSDFHLSKPAIERVRRLHFIPLAEDYTADVTPGTAIDSSFFTSRQDVPDSVYTIVDVIPESEAVTSVHFGPSSTKDYPIIHTGDDIVSIRTLVKAFCYYTFMATPVATTNGDTHVYFLGEFPLYGDAATEAPDELANIQPCWTWLTWFRMPYLAHRGSVRYMLDRPFAGNTFDRFSAASFWRLAYRFAGNLVDTTSVSNVYATTMADSMKIAQIINQGVAFQRLFVDGNHGYPTVEVPYTDLAVWRFKPIDNSITHGMSAVAIYYPATTTVTSTALHVAGGEDTSFSHYLAPPLCYMYSIPASAA
jgi:hypothetical protein